MTWTTIGSKSPGDAHSAATWNNEVKGNLDHIYDNLPTRATLWQDEAIATSGNALSFTVDTAQAYNGYARQAAANSDGDTFTHSCLLAAGSYTVSVLGLTAGSEGILDWDIDGSTVSTGQDWYSGSPVRNVVKTFTATISEGGRIVLTGTVNGKNASSSDYRTSITKIWFRQSSD